MQEFNCPSCGASIKFQSSISVSAVCPYCRSLVVRHDKDVELIGKMAELPPDISPFQIGTTGRYKNVGFTLVGRMKIGWADGLWTEWFLVSDEGKKGWLAEAQGFLAISYEMDDALHSRTQAAVTKKDVQLGASLTLNDKQFQITDIKDTECVGSEGELPFVAPKGRKTRAIDLIGRDGGFAGIEIDSSGTARYYLGEYAEFNDFGFANLRDLPGWNISAAAPITPTPKKKGKSDGGW